MTDKSLVNISSLLVNR